MVSRVRVGHFLQAVLAWLVLVPVLLVLGIIPITIFGLYRFTVVEILRKIFRRDLGEPLTLWDFALAADQFCGKSRGAISGIIIVEGELTSQTVQLRFEKIFSSSKFLRNYKRLTSVYPTHWLGYPFWAEIKTSLDISKHLKVVPVSDEDNFEEAREDWLVSPFASKQPLWDILHVPAFMDKNGISKSAVGVRIHHVIGDGISLKSFLFHELLGQEIEISTQKLSFGQKFVLKLQAIFWMPLNLGYQIFYLGIHRDYFSQQRVENNSVFVSTTTISLDKIKILRKDLNAAMGARVSFLNTLLLCISGAVRKLFINDPKLASEVDRMKNFVVGVGTPRLTPHPVQTFCNHMGVGFLEIPLREKDPIERLKILMEQESWLIASKSFETNLFFPWLNTIYPRWLYRKLTNSFFGTTINVGSLPGPPAPVYFAEEHLVLSMFGVVGLQFQNMSMTLMAISYNGELSLSVTSDRKVFPRETAKKLFQEYFHKEVEELLQSEFGINNRTAPSYFV